MPRAPRLRTGWEAARAWGALLVVCVFAFGTHELLAQEERPAPRNDRPVYVCELKGTVDAGSAAYLVDCVRRAEQRGGRALLVTLDTPGGSLESTREITRAFLAAKVPILLWVGPAGARAGSAGVFLTLASHVAAMAPATNIGAAHPVVGPGGADPEAAGGEELARKVENDAVAYAQALARERGRNAEWAAKAVRESDSITADRAVELKVVELIAPTPVAFVNDVHGRTVTTAAGVLTLDTDGAQLEPLNPSFRQRAVHWLAHPAVAYLLFLVGGLGIAIELSSPGMIAPGVIGVVCFVLAMVAFSALPIQAGAVALLLIGAGLIAAEFFVTSGLLGLGGVVLLAVGGVLLVDRVRGDWFVEPSFGLSAYLILPTAVLAGGAAIYVARRAAQARKAKQRTGDLGMIGEHGRALSEVDREHGEVFVHGERWQAVSNTPIPPGRKIEVLRVDGLTLVVQESL